MSETKRPGKPLSANAAKVRNHLASLSPEALKAMTPKTYRARTHHVGCTDAVFQMEKMRAKRVLGIPKREQAPRVSKIGKAPKGMQVHKATARLPAPGRSFEILAQVDLAAYSTMPLELLKAFAVDLLRQCMNNTTTIQVMLLSDPTSLEIRRPV